MFWDASRVGGKTPDNEQEAVALVSKTFVKVTAEHDESGQVRPLLVTWTDGKKYEIDRVTDVRQAPSLKGGGLGMRYTVKVRGKQVYLFEDEGRWFLDG